MTWLALLLYALGVVGAAVAVSWAADGGYEPPSFRKGVVIVCWPIAVAAAICLGLSTSLRRALQR